MEAQLISMLMYTEICFWGEVRNPVFTEQDLLKGSPRPLQAERKLPLAAPHCLQQVLPKSSQTMAEAKRGCELIAA